MNAMPLGALLRREVIAQLRRVRSFVTIVIVLLLLIWIVAAQWPSGDSLVWAQLPIISTGLLTGIVYYLLIGAALFVPGIAGTSVVVEREQQSWDLLALTQLRPSSIVVGKALGAVCMYLILVIAMFPIIGSLYFLVGIDWAQSVVSLGLVLLTAMTCSFGGIASSAWMRRSGPAVAWSYMAMLFVMGLPPAIVIGLMSVLVRYIFQTSLPYAEVVLMVVSPFPVLMSSAFGSWTSFTGVWLMFAGNILYQLVLIVVMFFIALAGVRRRKFRVEGAGISAAPPPLPRQRVSLRQRVRQRRLRRRKPRPPIPDRRNPIAVREIWWGTVGSARVLRGVGFLLFGISGVIVLLAWTDNWHNVAGTFLPAAIIIHGIILTVLAAGLGAGIFTKEDELRGLDMLRITLLTPREVVRGKFVAGLRMAGLFVLLSLICNSVLLFLAWNQTGSAVLWLAAHGTLLVCAWLAVSLAMTVSVFVQKTSTAIVCAFIACAGFFFGLPLILAVTDAFDTSSSFAQVLYAFSSPVIGFFYAADRFEPMIYDTPIREKHLLGFLTYWGVNCLEFLVVTCGVYLFARMCYARYRAQDA